MSAAVILKDLLFLRCSDDVWPQYMCKSWWKFEDMFNQFTRFTATSLIEVGTGPAERIYASALPLLKARRALFVRQSKKRVMGDGHPNPRFSRKSSSALRTNPPMPLAIFAAMPLPWTSSFLRRSLIHVHLYLDVSTAKGLFLWKLKTGYWKWSIGFTLSYA